MPQPAGGNSLSYLCPSVSICGFSTMTTRQTLGLLRAYESRNITFIAADGSWPIVWERAKGVHVWDADGRKYLDLTAAFGVAAAGHANPRVVRAGQTQMARLLHAMGDVHPHALKARLARELSRLTFERWHRKSKVRSLKSKVQGPESKVLSLESRVMGRHTMPATGKTIFCNSGFEAVEAALKTAMLATGKPGVIAFEGAYHGLGYGVLNATHREHFRSAFRPQLREFGHFVPFPGIGQASRRAPIAPEAAAVEAIESQIRHPFRGQSIGAVLVEPIQVRGGINIPPPGFLPILRRLCDDHEALLILDEIYTGFGRTGKWFACEHSGTVPDLICLGKALTGGFPLSACVGRADLMDAAWPPSCGEAIHTSTYLGHPVGCAMALAQIKEIRALKLVQRSAELGEFLRTALAELKPCTANFTCTSRGLGLLAGLEVRLGDGSPATQVVIQSVNQLLRRGFILLPDGEHSNVIGFTPPLTISERQLQGAVSALGDELHRYTVT
ncbi:MAG: aspartate aminotransferase family protein [Verrucomicrobia bacterium]|nr:aspartate aminotransferase family protein [Verrucomicrobiota bacterium]